MNNSLIMMTTTTSSSVLQDGIIPLTNISRRRGQVVNGGTNNVILSRPGYYRISASVTFTGQATGVASIQVQKSGVDVVGLTSSTSITTATTEERTLEVSGIVRVYCNEDLATITLVNTGIAITSSNVKVDVEYLG